MVCDFREREKYGCANGKRNGVNIRNGLDDSVLKRVISISSGREKIYTRDKNISLGPHIHPTLSPLIG